MATASGDDVTESLDQRLAEFEEHLWDHTSDSFQQAFDRRLPLTEDGAAFLSSVVALICERRTDEEISLAVRERVNGNTEMMHLILQVVGLTRNKVLTDLRSGASGELKIPGDVKNLPKSDAVWSAAADYLIPRLRVVFSPLCAGDQYRTSLESLNQATWLGWIRQERAKRQGHDAEYRLARILHSLNLPFEPRAKIDNPLSPDAQVHGISFDLVVPREFEPLMCVKATVHTSNIGQYGESKDKLEIEEASAVLKAHFELVPTLVALIDGIGFRSNRAGLRGVLEGADEFCQFKSIWKGAAVAASRLERTIAVALPPDEIVAHAAFLDRYNEHVEVTTMNESPSHSVQAGEALVWMR